MRYAVYVESFPDGRSMAHILDLPGCTAVGETQEKALEGLQTAAEEYHLWLNSHGDYSVSPEEAVELKVVEAVEGVAPLAPGDAAALFKPDREPMDDAAFARYLRLMAYARADLTALISTLSDDRLDRVVDEEGASIRTWLNHIANAEEWYISRLGAEDHPYHIAMSDRFEEADVRVRLVAVREMAVRRLAVLTPEERAAVFARAEYTEHPEEAWTARKVLRRFVEHEREHTVQIATMLDLGYDLDHAPGHAPRSD